MWFGSVAIRAKMSALSAIGRGLQEEEGSAGACTWRTRRPQSHGRRVTLLGAQAVDRAVVQHVMTACLPVHRELRQVLLL